MLSRLHGRWGWVVTAALALCVTGCGSDGTGGGLGLGGGGGGSSDPNAQSLRRHSDTLTSDEAYHLLRRAAFGATRDQVARAVEQGLTATVADLMTVKATPETLTALEETYENDVRKRWLIHLIDGPNPLHERMTLFWHDRFATSGSVVDGREKNLVLQHWRMLRRNALGNYRQFLEELTIDPLMLIWLDGANSPKDNPNENYTREFWELFTLGRDTLYTEEDIREGARAFTGITLLRERDQDPRPVFDLVNHDETFKEIFPEREEPANHDYHTMIDMTLRQPEAPRYVARNLFAMFVHDHPSDATLDELARVLVDSDFEIAPVVERILTSEALFSDDAKGNQISSPVEHYVCLARTLDMHFFSEESQGGTLNRLVNDLSAAGQELLNPPGVQGWTEGTEWLQDQWIIARAEAMARRLDFGPDRVAVLPYHLLPAANTWDRREVREEIVTALASAFHLKLTAEERDIYIEVLDQNGWRAFHLLDPQYQPSHVVELIRLMSMHEGVIGS